MLRIVMDSAGEIPNEWRSEYEVHVIPVNIQFENKTYQQGIDLSNDDFYRLADTTGVIPKTSQPTPQQFVDFYKRIAQAGDTILSLHVTSKLSGTFNSAVMAAQELKDKLKVIPFDSGSGSAALGFMCKEVRQLERAGATLQSILERLEIIRRNVHVVLTLDSLEYARRSGRVKALPAAIAALIKIKPIVILKDGALDMKEKVRTRQRSISRVIEIIHDRVDGRLVNVAVVHSQSLQAARQLMERVKQTLRINELILSELSIGVAANLGPGTIGIIAYAVA
ncbi:MAG TPA: DegV family protein [Anaerolineales bacterium]|nr:DegV family protein [Anaerolineales bacterium]